MSLNETVAGAVKKKDELLTHDFLRFATRATLAGVYLTVATAFAAVVGQGVNTALDNTALGAVFFALFFGLGLFAIVILNAELATGDMMFMSYGAVQKKIGWGKAVWLLVVTTFFNLIGAALIAALLGYSAKFNDFDSSHLIATLSEGKLDKGPWQAFVEGMGANFVVNMGIVGALFAKDLVSKFFVIVPFIAIFVGLGLEHIIANFSLFTLTFFNAGFDPALMPENFTIGAVGINWLMVWLGNFVGGGVLIGGVYAYLNMSKNEVYRD